MYSLVPVTERVRNMRKRYRETKPEICLARYRLVTEYYQAHPELSGILRRAKNFYNICENIPVRIDEDEVIVGAQSTKYRATALYPENSAAWLKDEILSGSIATRELDPYQISDEDRAYVADTIDYWVGECLSAKTDAQTIDEYLQYDAFGVLLFRGEGQAAYSVGHFCANYDKAVRRGIAAIGDEAREKRAALIHAGLPGSDIDCYNFYRAIEIVTDGMRLLAQRYAGRARELADTCSNPGRKAELAMMAEALAHCMEGPSESYFEALQTVFFYHTCLFLDANIHAISLGRIDQYVGDFYERDIEKGRITEEYGQELLDLFYLKLAEINRPWSEIATLANPGYVNNMLITIGGVKPDGEDATNPVTYMMLQSAGRLILHDPPIALRIHDGTDPALFEAAIETTKIAGGVPTFENDELIIPVLQKRGLSLESARNYCLIGCVEPTGTGDEWGSPGGTGSESYINLANILLVAINDGYNPLGSVLPVQPLDEGAPIPFPKRAGLPTGKLGEMKSMDEVLAAVEKQLRFFVGWQAMNVNSFEYIAREIMPNPTASATFDGCMEKGMDVMRGGAKYNSTGMSGVGVGNVADSLNIIEHLCFETGRCTTQTLYDAIMANWVGYEDLRAYIQNEAPHYGNGLKDADKYAAWIGTLFGEAVNACTGPRGSYSAGLYPVTTNVIFGKMTAATPDGRVAGEPLADGISPVQQMDKNGPTAILLSVSNIDQSLYPNGTLLNLKFHPSAMNGSDSVEKLAELIRAYFRMGGMEVQINVISAEILRAAQASPDDFRDLVVRVAGFSAYFVELHIDGQEDLIRRTELAM